MATFTFEGRFDGVALLADGQELGVFGSLWDASNARRFATHAACMLDDLLGSAARTRAILNATAADLQRRFDGDA